MQQFDTTKLYILLKPLIVILMGLMIGIAGYKFLKSPALLFPAKVEVLGETTSESDKTLTVEISGGVVNPGVYKVSRSARVEDLLNSANGLTANADSTWCAKYLNRAAFLSDGQKVYIPTFDEHSDLESAKNRNIYQTGSTLKTSDSNDRIDINTASLEKLESLPGIGRTYAQKIVEHRPYSTVDELVKKGIIKQTLLDKLINSISVF